MKRPVSCSAPAGYAATAEGELGAFGSWLVAIEHSPRLRVVWDGKDGWAVIQLQTDELFAGRPVWKDIWIGTTSEDQTPHGIVRALQSLASA
jgi:hypothetical protein